MRGTIDSIYRHPVKGLTPEPMAMVQLTAGAYFPGDRDYAIEVGPSGFDPANPKHISKQRFTVLARFPALARVKTRLDDATRVAPRWRISCRLSSARKRQGNCAFWEARRVIASWTTRSATSR